MAGPVWLADALAAALVAVALYCAARLVRALAGGRRGHRDADLVDVLMAAVMAAMLVGSVSLGAVHWWAMGFGVAAIWFGWRSLYAYVLDGWGAPPIRQHARHGLLCAAMVYMITGASAPAAAQPAVSAESAVPHAAMPGMAEPAGAGALPLLLLAVLLAAVVCVGVADACRLVARRSAATGRVVREPLPVGWCRLAMSVATGYMLMIML